MANNRPDWGAALQSLGQSLSGYAQQDYERKRLAYEQERERLQREADRKYADDLYNTRLEAERKYKDEQDPFVNTPSQMENIGGWGVIPGQPGIDLNTLETQNPDWFPALPSQPIRMRQSDLNQARVNWGVDQENFRQQQEINAQQNAASLDRVNAAAQARAQATAAKNSAVSDIYGGLPDAKAFNTFATSLVTPEETAFQGLGYQDMVTQELLKMASEGILLDSAAGVEAERRVRERVTPKFSYLGQELAYEPGAQYDGGSGQWYSPKSYSYSPPQTRPGWIKDKKGELVPLDVAGASATNAQQIQPFKYETMARDIIAPALESGFISIAQLKKVAEQTKTPWEQLRTWIPDAIDKATQAEGLGAAVSRRAVASETSPVEINWDEIN